MDVTVHVLTCERLNLCSPNNWTRESVVQPDLPLWPRSLEPITSPWACLTLTGWIRRSCCLLMGINVSCFTMIWFPHPCSHVWPWLVSSVWVCPFWWAPPASTWVVAPWCVSHWPLTSQQLTQETAELHWSLKVHQAWHELLSFDPCHLDSKATPLLSQQQRKDRRHSSHELLAVYSTFMSFEPPVYHKRGETQLKWSNNLNSTVQDLDAHTGFYLARGTLTANSNKSAAIFPFPLPGICSSLSSGNRDTQGVGLGLVWLGPFGLWLSLYTKWQGWPFLTLDHSALRTSILVVHGLLRGTTANGLWSLEGQWGWLLMTSLSANGKAAKWCHGVSGVCHHTSGYDSMLSSVHWCESSSGHRVVTIYYKTQPCRIWAVTRRSCSQHTCTHLGVHTPLKSCWCVPVTGTWSPMWLYNRHTSSHVNEYKHTHIHILAHACFCLPAMTNDIIKVRPALDTWYQLSQDYLCRQEHTHPNSFMGTHCCFCRSLSLSPMSFSLTCMHRQTCSHPCTHESHKWRATPILHAHISCVCTHAWAQTHTSKTTKNLSCTEADTQMFMHRHWTWPAATSAWDFWSNTHFHTHTHTHTHTNTHMFAWNHLQMSAPCHVGHTQTI